MDYERELKYLKNVLNKQRIAVNTFTSERVPTSDIDFGLRRISNREVLNILAFKRSFGDIRDRVLYKLKDEFYCRYVLLQLPDEQKSVLIIGPYTDFVVSGELLLESAARLSISPRELSCLEDSYGNIPVLSDDNFLFSMLCTFADFLWGSAGGYEVLDLNEELSERLTPVQTQQVLPTVEEMMVSMQLMEQRYAWENELMLLVSKGQSSRAEKMLPDMANFSFKQRLTDPVRNIKNYCIICNTLMRKAAQQGGVHPIYLDSVSSEYAAKIEQQTDIDALTSLVSEMIHNYCRLVRKHSMKDYSQPVRRAILLIDSQLSGELSLRHIAAVLQLNPSYLSSLFKKETGNTITEFICIRRIRQAGNLLRNTAMQIQDVALYCGIPDANYFSKLFKKHTGFSPGEYRNLPQAKL